MSDGSLTGIQQADHQHTPDPPVAELPRPEGLMQSRARCFIRPNLSPEGKRMNGLEVMELLEGLSFQGKV